MIVPVAYRLALPASSEYIHDVFHVSMLRKYLDPANVLDIPDVQFDNQISYEESQNRY